MSKLSRSVLKEIVKECIIEIFEESFFTKGDLVYESKKSYSQPSNTISRQNKRPVSRPNSKTSYLDSVSFNSKEMSESTQRFDKKIDKITSNLTNDPVMANIFKDTASTTLQQQIGASSRINMPVTAGADAATAMANQSDPTELFSESASKWATLAFAENIKR